MWGPKMDRYHLPQSGGCWYAAGTPNSPSFHVLLIQAFPCQPFISLSLSLTHPPQYTCFPLRLENGTEAVLLPPCPWALLAPAPLKRLVTQASSGPRVWKPPIEDCPQSEWQTQGRFCIAVVIYAEGRVRASRFLGAELMQWAMVITCYSSWFFLSLHLPSPAKS